MNLSSNHQSSSCSFSFSISYFFDSLCYCSSTRRLQSSVIYSMLQLSTSKSIYSSLYYFCVSASLASLSFFIYSRFSILASLDTFFSLFSACFFESSCFLSFLFRISSTDYGYSSLGSSIPYFKLASRSLFFARFLASLAAFRSKRSIR